MVLVTSFTTFLQHVEVLIDANSWKILFCFFLLPSSEEPNSGNPSRLCLDGRATLWFLLFGTPPAAEAAFQEFSKYRQYPRQQLVSVVSTVMLVTGKCRMGVS
jgi:hypothetical protein